MHVYHNNGTQTLVVDFSTRQVTIPLPEGLAPHEIAAAIQSETVRAIIRQLVGEPHGK